MLIGHELAVVWSQPAPFASWYAAASSRHGSLFAMMLVALLLFPKLALGLSGFETGVSVMPLVQGDPGDSEDEPIGRIRNTKTLLTVAALIMSVLLVGSSIVTTMLVPPAGVRRRVARRTAARSPTSPTSISARPSEPSTTSAR